QQPAGLGQPDPPAGPLQQLRPRLALEPTEVVADRRLRVVQLARRGGDRSVAGDRVEHTQPGDVQHPSILSMDEREHWHWTDAPLAGNLAACPQPSSPSASASSSPTSASPSTTAPTGRPPPSSS